MPIETKMADDDDVEDDVDDEVVEEDGKRFDPYDEHKYRPVFKKGVKTPYRASKDSIEKISIEKISTLLSPVV